MNNQKPIMMGLYFFLTFLKLFSEKIKNNNHHFLKIQITMFLFYWNFKRASNKFPVFTIELKMSEKFLFYELY